MNTLVDLVVLVGICAALAGCGVVIWAMLGVWRLARDLEDDRAREYRLPIQPRSWRRPAPIVISPETRASVPAPRRAPSWMR